MGIPPAPHDRHEPNQNAGNEYEYDKDVNIVDEWGILATGNAEEHSDYLNRIPQDCKDQVKDYFKNRPKK